MRNIWNMITVFFSLFNSCDRWLKQGNKYYLNGRYEQALKYYQKILKKYPYHISALCNQGNIFLLKKNYRAALIDAKKIITKFPGQECGWSLYGKIHLETENFEDAQTAFNKAISIAPHDFWNWNYLSQALQKNGHEKEALEAAYRAVELSKGEDFQHLNLSYAIYEISSEKGKDIVLPIVSKWQKKYSKNPIVEQSVASLFHDRNHISCDPVYIEKVFDNFASEFDEILSSLSYSSPQRIAEIIKKNMCIDSTYKYKILDLGCGTGLCGKAIDSLFKKRELCGIDLSTFMLAEARHKGVYNHLEKAEIKEYLSTAKTLYNIVISADVLTYFGQLEDMFLGVFSILLEGGFFVFSITQNIEDEQDFFLHASGRFSHTKKYIETTLKNSGFHNIIFEDSFLRKEGEKDVLGWIIFAQK